MMQKIKAQDKPEIKVGGALRFNYHYDSWRDDLKKQGGELVYDVFRINAQAKYKKVSVNAEYRFYSNEFGGNFIKQGWIGYDFNKKDKIHLGLIQVPFGIQQYNSNNWFFNLPYYVGLEDDHDIGVKFLHEKEEGINYQLAFFKNAEYTGFGGGEITEFGRYSYDITSFNDFDGDGDIDFRNKELNTLSGKLEYVKKDKSDGQHRIGASAKIGQLYNFDTEKNGSSAALEAHYQFTKNNWDFKLQALTYNHDTEAPLGEATNVVSMSAYGFPYLVAAKANIYTAGVKYSHNVDWGPISNLSFYNDFGLMDKSESSFENSYMNVTGVLVSAGMLYVYADFAQGKNHSWIGGNFVDDFAQGNPNAGWEYRFNINFGFYF